MSSHVQKVMKEYLLEILNYVNNGNKKGVVSSINEMKNFYMVEENLKPGKKNPVIENVYTPTEPLDTSNPPNEPIEKKKIDLIGKEIPNYQQNPDKPRKNIFY